jgi:uncharacterized phage-associated protein
MSTIVDVAKYILESQGEMSSMKLQKLTYYCQAWSLVWEEEALFDNEFQAWANGPVSPLLYERHRGQFKVGPSIVKDGDVSCLTGEQKETIDVVLEHYGAHSAQSLSDLTHKEAPWLIARGDLDPLDRSNEVVTLASMHEYYTTIE